MWTCPKCGREFKRTNQGHYCGKAPESVDEYIEAQAPEAQAHAAALRSIILRCAPEVREKISWSMPYFEKDGRTLSFAVCKNHISLYLDAEVIQNLRPQLDGYAIRKNAVYLPHDSELPAAAIESAGKQTFETQKATR